MILYANLSEDVRHKEFSLLTQQHLQVLKA